MKFLLLFLLSFSLYAKDLPKGLKWITNNEEPSWGSKEAQRGGTFYSYLNSFPLTMRFVGPNSNGGFRGYILDGGMIGLITFHPNTKKFIPQAAKEWAYGEDGRTIYFRLHDDMKWNDGKPITADDYVYIREFYTSDHLKAPWYKENYTNIIVDISKYDKHTISITRKTKLPPSELLYGLGSMTPIAKHYYKLSKDFLKKFDWKKPLTNGPYEVGKIRKGKSITLERVKDWWGDEKRYFKNRFNVDRVNLKIIRDDNIAYQHFLKGNLDSYWLQRPEWWHDRAKGPEYDKGYAHKLWFYTDKPISDYYIVMNTDKPPLDNKDVRIAVSHAINVDKVSNTLLRGDYTRIRSTMDGMGEYTNTDVKPRPYDPKMVEKHLKKAGWGKRGSDGIRVKNGKRLTVTLTYGTKAMEGRLVVFREEAKKVGIELDLKLLDAAAAFKSALEKQHQMYYGAWGGSMFPAYWEFWHSDNAKKQTNNFANLDSKKVDKLIDQFRKEENDSKRKSLSRQIQKAVHDEAVIIPLWKSPFFRVAHWPWLKLPEIQGTRMSPSHPFSAYIFDVPQGVFWIDQKLKKKVRKMKKEGKAYSKAVTIKNEIYKN